MNLLLGKCLRYWYKMKLPTWRERRRKRRQRGLVRVKDNKVLTGAIIDRPKKRGLYSDDEEELVAAAGVEAVEAEL